MNWILFAAGALMTAAAGLHGVVGDALLRKITRLEFPPAPFGGSPGDTKAVTRITWHFGTVAFFFVGGWLVATGVRPQATFAVGVTYLSGTFLSFLASIALVVTIYRRGPRGLLKQPGPVLLTTTSILVWWGSALL